MPVVVVPELVVVLVLELEDPPEPDVLELLMVSVGVSMRIWSLHAVVKKRVATKKEKMGRIVGLCVRTDRARLRLRAKGRLSMHQSTRHPLGAGRVCHPNGTNHDSAVT